MIAPLDIFGLKDGETTWVGAAESLQQALQLATRKGEGLYFVFSQRTGHKEFYTVGPDKKVQRTASLDFEA